MYMVTQKQPFSLTDIFPYVSCPSFLSFFLFLFLTKLSTVQKVSL